MHWADGGETKLSSLVTSCGDHHRLSHEGGYGVSARGSAAKSEHERSKQAERALAAPCGVIVQSRGTAPTQ